MKRFALIGFVLLFVSCGDDNPLDVAWQKFRNQEYVEAHAAFTELIPSEGGQAYIGLGWTTLKMDSIPEADGYFRLAIVTQDSILEGVAGISFSSWALAQYNSSIISSENVIRRRPTFVFTHDRTVTYHDMYVHQAYSEFRLSRFSASLQTVQRLQPGYTLPSADTVGGLLAKLDSLYDQYK